MQFLRDLSVRAKLFGGFGGCVAEELDTLPAPCGHGVSAVALGAHARSLTTRCCRG
jgi:hypothetical protein